MHELQQDIKAYIHATAAKGASPSGSPDSSGKSELLPRRLFQSEGPNSWAADNGELHHHLMGNIPAVSYGVEQMKVEQVQQRLNDYQERVKKLVDETKSLLACGATFDIQQHRKAARNIGEYLMDDILILDSLANLYQEDRQARNKALGEIEALVEQVDLVKSMLKERQDLINKADSPMQMKALSPVKHLVRRFDNQGLATPSKVLEKVPSEMSLSRPGCASEVSSQLSVRSMNRPFWVNGFQRPAPVGTEELALRLAERGQRKLARMRQRNVESYHKAVSGASCPACATPKALTTCNGPQLLTPQRAQQRLHSKLVAVATPPPVERSGILCLEPWDERTSCSRTFDGKPLRAVKQLLH